MKKIVGVIRNQYGQVSQLVDKRDRQVQLVTVAGKFVDFTDAEPVIAKVKRLDLRLVNGDIVTDGTGSEQFLLQ